MHAVTALLALVALAVPAAPALAADAAPEDSAQWGLRKESPIKVCQPAGQQAYLEQPDYHVIDRYDVHCGETTTAVCMDMYHCPAVPVPRAPAGFTLQD